MAGEARKAWKRIHRASRIARREAGKALMDAAFYGTGIVAVPKDGADPYHVPIQEFLVRREGRGS